MTLPGGDEICPDDALQEGDQNYKLRADEDYAGQLELDASVP